MTGSSPSWRSQAARLVSRGCSRSQDRATAVPQRVVWVTVVTGGPARSPGRELELGAVPGRAAVGAGCARRGRGKQHPVGEETAQQLHGQIRLQER